MDALEEELVKGLQTLESDHQRVKSITGGEWIIDSGGFKSTLVHVSVDTKGLLKNNLYSYPWRMQ